jgi:hypothetical protein
MYGRQADQRLSAREAQTRAWSAPVPDVTAVPRMGTGGGMEPRVRLEWDTRDTANNRMWANTLDMGAKDVTSASLAAHPTAGASPFMPSASRDDHRPYGDAPRWEGVVSAAVAAPPDPRVSGWKPRPVGAPGSLFQNAWLDGFDVEGGEAARELRGVIREDMTGRSEDVAARITERTFENQWMSGATRTAVIRAQMDAASALRPQQDDWRAGGGKFDGRYGRP